ncbi:MAG: Do family serine endopeptidase [Candidatus Latescibacteria bacterium]|nr:Do family serine endopeptidase [Candidatus Latescibacterota bacterium]
MTDDTKKTTGSQIRIGLIVAVAVIAAFVIGLFIAGSFNLGQRNTMRAEEPSAPIETKYPMITADGTSPFVYVADIVIPTVVNISAEKVVKVKTPDSWWPFDDLFRDFFKDVPRLEPRQQERRSQTLGSGVIISEDGYILTNNHVVADYENFVVRLSDKTEFKGKKVKVVGRDPKTDVAVLKLDVDNRKLPAAKMGNSDNIRVGDWAIAVGIPFGLDGTVTVGVISAKGRSNIPLPEISYQDFIQTDASINPGNSGGPLVNIKGEVIGINTAIRSPVGASVGIGFATPINLVKDIADQLISKGKIVRGYLGVFPQEISQDLKKALNLPSTEGVLLAEVVDNTPAAKAGLKAGDVVVKFAGKKIIDVQQFRRVVAEYKPGSEIQIEVIRDGKTMTFKAKLDEMPGEVSVQTKEKEDKQEDQDKKVWLGITAKSRTASDGKGVLIDEVESGSIADLAGIQQGDIILKIDKYDIETLKDFSKAADDLKNSKKPILFRLRRGTASLFIAVTPE